MLDSTAAPAIPKVNPGTGRPGHEEREDHGWFRDHDDRDGFREDGDDH